MKTNIYGVDTSKEVTPLMVRDAIVECFRQAHCADSGIGSSDKEVNQAYCREIVSKSFTDSGADFNNPTKDGILRAMNKLAEFAKNFRDQKIVQKNYSEIIELVNKIV